MTTETDDNASVTMTRGELKSLVASAVATATNAPDALPAKKATEMTRQEWKAAKDKLKMTGRVQAVPATAPATPAASAPPPPATPVKDARQMSSAEWARARRDLRMMGRIA